MLGTWAAGTAYKTGEVVQYGGNTYVYKVSSAAGTLPTDNTKADLLVEGVSHKGTYSSVLLQNR